MPIDSKDLELQRQQQILRFTRILALALVAFAALPALIGWITATHDSLYLGIQTNLDDHMVYAAWMRQAMDFHFLFDNRFAVDSQPGLTIHLYFAFLGLIAKFLGIPLTMTVARLALTFLLVRLLGRLMIDFKVTVFTAKSIMFFVCFGGGIGFMAWEKFGQTCTDKADIIRTLFGDQASVDVWQPEAFVFPSMLTNGLFLVSLILILLVIQSVIQAKDSWSPVLRGALCFGLLMNIHSYDALLIGLVLLGFLASQFAQKEVTSQWVVRSLVIASGAILPALWFVYVLQHDPVFQARAATPTYSPGFRSVLLGFLPLLVLAVVAMIQTDHKRKFVGIAGIGLIIVTLLMASSQYNGQQFMIGWAAWVALFAIGLISIACLSTKSSLWNIALSWAVISLFALYFPALFQRKLAMGLAIPWAILGAHGLDFVLQKLERSNRNLVASLSFIICGWSSLLWFQRELLFVRDNVGSTAVHPVWFSADTRAICDALNHIEGRKVVLAMPGVWNSVGPNDFRTPIVPDINSVISGLTGSYTYAGHWSETPDYNKRRSLVTQLYLGTTPLEKRKAILQYIQPDYVVALNSEAFPEISLGDQKVPLVDLTSIGETIYKGTQMSLIKVSKS